MRANDVAGNVPGMYRSPRHMMRVHTIVEGSTYVVSMSWRALPGRHYPEVPHAI
jgi:hypothetical protein